MGEGMGGEGDGGKESGKGEGRVASSLMEVWLCPWLGVRYYIASSDSDDRFGVRPELIIACDVRGHGERLHRCSWPPLQLARAAYRLFAHAFHVPCILITERQTDRRTDITTGLHTVSFAFTGSGCKTSK